MGIFLLESSNPNRALDENAGIVEGSIVKFTIFAFCDAPLVKQ
jgi:hypothetical protein